MASTMKANLMENQLRQKVIQFENSLARISDTRRHLRDNADLVKSEIRATFGTQLTQLRRREQQLLETLDTVVSVKDGILSDQQDQLHQALGACVQGLEWYETAVEDMKESRLSSIDTVEHHINDVLKKLSVIEVKPRETAALSFEADALAIRKAIASFGHVRTAKHASTKAPESLPAQLEDYEDEDMVHSLLHKAVNRNGKNPTTVFVGRPALSNNPEDWLLRQALVGRHSPPLAPEHGPDAYSSHCTNTAAVDGTGNRQGHVHSWLHHIKNQVEFEPNVFEDFEIVKEQEVKHGKQCDSIKAELSGEVAALFRPYFQAVLMSPSNQWLLQEMDMELSRLAMGDNKPDQLGQGFVVEGDVEDMESCPSTVTYESSGELFDTVKNSLTQETYGQLWQDFVRALWESTDSLWILPCSSDNDPKPLVVDANNSIGTNCGENARWLHTATPEQRHKIVTDVVDGMIASRLGDISLTHKAQIADYSRWLLQSNKAQPVGMEGHCGQAHPFEEWLGWKALVKRINEMGDHCWLANTAPDETNKGGVDEW